MIRVNRVKVHAILKSRRWNRARLARELGVSKSLITLVLNLKRAPSRSFINRLLSTLGVRFEDVFFLSPVLPSGKTGR